jgi:DNA polymerase-3 subunit epsilon
VSSPCLKKPVPVPDIYVLIDLETTGANPVTDRITEIAAIRVEHGEITGRWESLVNPQRRIPPFIQNIIGITDDMVRDAPGFAELAPKVREVLDGATFVAHNARFDYGFICNEFQRLGEQFEAPVMCTVKFSRALFPEHHRHGLDALIDRHGLECGARHRAMGDADAVWQFLQLAQQRFAPETLERAWARAMKFPKRPPALPEGMLEGLPDAPGVYVFLGEGDEPLFVGRAVSLRARLMEQFGAIERKGKEGDLLRAVRRLDWVETAGELSASLLELELVRARRPRHNRPLASSDGPCALHVELRRRSPPLIRRVPIDGSDPAGWIGLHGAFRGAREADAALRDVVAAYGLCRRRCGLESGATGPCSARRAGQCAGACVRRESPETHDERLLGALAPIGVKPWPWDGPIVVTEHSAHTGSHAFQVFDQWCHLGSADSLAALQALLADPRARAFSLDVWRLLTRWMAQPGNVDRIEPASSARFASAADVD